MYRGYFFICFLYGSYVRPVLNVILFVESFADSIVLYAYLMQTRTNIVVNIDSI